MASKNLFITVDKKGNLGEPSVFFDAAELAKQGIRGGYDGMKLDSKGNIWLSFTSGNIIRISKNGEKLFQPKEISNARYIFEDNSGQVWFGFGYKGIGFINQED